MLRCPLPLNYVGGPHINTFYSSFHRCDPWPQPSIQPVWARGCFEGQCPCNDVPETTEGGDRVTPAGLVPSAGNGFSPLYMALCISIKANGTKQNPITGEQTGGLSAARPLYCFNHGANGAFGATGMLSEKHVSPTFQ